MTKVSQVAMTQVPQVTIDEAKNLAAQYGLVRVIVYFEQADGKIGYTSYGKTKALCEGTRRIADGMWDRFGAGCAKEATR